MKVLGIGNAIVDVICKVKESFLSQNQLTKGTMKLVNEVEFKKLLSNLKIEETIAGGSVANSIVGLSHLGNQVSFIGKVNNDDLGNKYEKSLTNEKVKYCYQKKAGHTLLLHGRYTCKARTPSCKTCVIIKFCKYKNKELS